MDQDASARDGFNWRLPLFAVAVTLIILVPITVYDDFGQFIVIVAGTPIVSFIFLVIAILAAIRKKWLRGLSVVSALIAYCVVSWLLLRNSPEVRAEGRWFLWSKKYEAEVLAQGPAPNGELKHIEWDGFGWAGSETVVYLVFDPSDTLHHAANSHSPGKFDGIPCEVPLVHRLERNWYSVRFYTNSGWGVCS